MVQYKCEACQRDLTEEQYQQYNKKCILHCDKSDYSTDWNKIGFLNEFYNHLIEYINVKYIKMEFIHLKRYFDEISNNSLDSHFVDKTIVFKEIFFPAYKGVDSFDYSRILRKLKKIHFNYCKFQASHYELDNIKVFFQDCKFYNNYSISNCDIATNVSDVIYQQCLFKKAVTVSHEENAPNTIDNSLFSDCCFQKGIYAENIEFKKKVFNNLVTKRIQHCKKMEFINCVHDGDLILKDHTINVLNLRESTFLGKVKIQFCHIKEKTDFYNTKFENLADFYRTEFSEIDCERADFNHISVFSEAIFNKDIVFKYSKFSNKAIFRDAIVKEKIDFRDTIFADDANFLDISSHKDSARPIKVANRETARIIKNFYENTNNIIESNKFYTLEMQAREKELDNDIKNGKNFFEWIVFKMHSISSNHSQDWVLAFFWIVYITFVYSYLEFFIPLEEKTNQIIFSFFIFGFMAMYALLQISLDKEVKDGHKLIILLFLYMIYGFYTQDYQLIKFSINMNPFSIMKNNESLNILTLLYKVMIAYLMYQLIISIRQNTRRK